MKLQYMARLSTGQHPPASLLPGSLHHVRWTAVETSVGGRCDQHLCRETLIVQPVGNRLANSRSGCSGCCSTRRSCSVSNLGMHNDNNAIFRGSGRNRVMPGARSGEARLDANPDRSLYPYDIGAAGWQSGYAEDCKSVNLGGDSHSASRLPR